jgi:hypothetical protein
MGANPIGLAFVVVHRVQPTRTLRKHAMTSGQSALLQSIVFFCFLTLLKHLLFNHTLTPVDELLLHFNLTLIILNRSL